MLNQDTKRRIDSCRDILVGKLTNPFSQVEQITIALIYKFMDDMDKEAVEMGGKVSFFTGEYEQYSWTNIFDPRIGGHELVRLYGEAIERMNQNPKIPQLFRDIFKNAYLPYRDPETLKLFLKEINNFDYSHSEKLGDAFEYLLSFLGTQGDAGQFRTPRHIIDFIVEVVKPQKNETILDPACGTAGFLISAYKHILKANSSKKSPLDLPDKAVQAGRGGPDTPCRDRGVLGNQLTPTEKKRLLTNFSGYDIDPLMRKLSLVNLYLHGFQDPKIYEYDTLTSEERWNDSADVILANPPFMTPKGGIRPHKRFSIQAKRSEVLFVDYIAEHLNPGGRAGVIVPEGIIFQSSNAYKNLRKMLIEDYLWAVVSLPAGVFQPYSGVKTSILLMDKRIAKKSKEILFIKVENDGFDLGAQRRPIDKNDLPEALRILESIDYVDGAPTQTEQSKTQSKEIAHWVEKSKIAESGDWNLSGERYKEHIDYSKLDAPLYKVNEICSMGRGRVISKKEINANLGEYPVYSSQTVNKGIFGYLNTYDFEGEYVTWTTDGANAGTVFHRQGKFNCTNVCGTLKAVDSKVNMKYLAHTLNHIAYKYVTKVGNPKLMNREMGNIQTPLPPLPVQEEIVAEIDGYQKIIDGARQVVDNYKPTIPPALLYGRASKINPDWEMVKLGEVCEVISGQSPKGEFYNTNCDGLAFYQGKTEFTEMKIGAPKKWTTQVTKEAFENDILMSVRAPVGPVNFATQHCCIGRGLAAIRVGDKVENVFVFNYLKSIQDKIKGSGGAVFDSINRQQISELQIPLPPLSVQQEIVTQIEAEQEMVDGNKKLIEIYEQKIKDKIGAVWGL